MLEITEEIDSFWTLYFMSAKPDVMYVIFGKQKAKIYLEFAFFLHEGGRKYIQEHLSFLKPY